jgi:enamine deaminase RidA (YjgF/YER057c/UK114 family)
MDALFRDIFPVNPPVRATVGVASLARDCKFEVEVTAAR